MAAPMLVSGPMATSVIPAGILADAVEEKIHRWWMGLRRWASLGPARLRKGSLALRADAFCHGDACATRFREQAIDEPGAELRVSPGGRDAENFHFGAGKREADRESVVYIVANVGVDDDFRLCSGCRRRTRRQRRRRLSAKH